MSKDSFLFCDALKFEGTHCLFDSRPPSSADVSSRDFDSESENYLWSYSSPH
jgi:hypothetical protein